MWLNVRNKCVFELRVIGAVYWARAACLAHEWTPFGGFHVRMKSQAALIQVHVRVTAESERQGLCRPLRADPFAFLPPPFLRCRHTSAPIACLLVHSFSRLDCSRSRDHLSD